MNSLVYQETIHAHYRQCFDVEHVLYEQKNELQHLIIFENGQFGRVMALDGVIQTTEKDEFIYHEMLVHVPIFAHGDVKNVLIIGGGDGGMLRECLQHESVERVTLVEIDEAVIEMAKKYFPHHSQGAFDAKRTDVVIDDGCRFVKQTQQQFDLIICDSTDPIGPGEALFTQGFYQDCKQCLNPGGVMVTQNGVLHFQMDESKNTLRAFRNLYQMSCLYRAAIPTYVGGDMAFGFASDNERLNQPDLASIEKRFAQSGIKTRYYTPQIHLGCFAMPQYVLDELNFA